MLDELVCGLQHIGIATADLAKTICFFKSLGFQTIWETQNEGQDVCFLALENVQIEAYQSHDAVSASGTIDHIALDVRDIEKVYSHITDLGYDVQENGIRFLPFWEHGVRFFTVIGPGFVKIEFSENQSL